MFLMKISVFSIAFLCIFFGCIKIIDESVGKWKNVDGKASGLAELQISKIDDNVLIETWFKIKNKKYHLKKREAQPYRAIGLPEWINQSTAYWVMFDLDSVSKTIHFHPLTKARAMISVEVKNKLNNKFSTNQYIFFHESNPPDKVNLKTDNVVKPMGYVELTDSTITQFITRVAFSRSSELQGVKESISKARQNPHIVTKLKDELDKCVENDLGKSLIILSILGELKLPACIDIFNTLIWKDLPKDFKFHYHRFSLKDRVEMQAAKAVECLAALQTEAIDEHILKIVREHKSKVVRASAINVHLFYHNDSEIVKNNLRKIIKSDDLSLIDRVRKSKMLSGDNFEKKVKDFYSLFPQSLKSKLGVK